MTTTPTPEALRHRAAARRWALAGEWGFTAASSAVNVTVITAAGGTLLRILLAGLAPVVLAAMSRLITKVLQAELVVSGTADRVNWAVAGAVGVIGAGAFYLSFETLRRAAEPDHGGMAWVFPATLDLAIVVCAVVLAVIARADETDQRNGVPPRATTWTRLTARFSGDRDTASVTRHVAADHRAADPDLELTSPDSLTWLAAPPARHDADQEPNHDARQKAAPQPVSSDDWAASSGSSPTGNGSSSVSRLGSPSAWPRLRIICAPARPPVGNARPHSTDCGPGATLAINSTVVSIVPPVARPVKVNESAARSAE
ncbi:DUF2637 domain-containing protein [Mycolicibacterium smegmatis]|nr:DUF2637 domain-containing protein [Mycolicibacterium smegmatis]MCP2622042.1 DUF2637 domain-containing protein [Mycolicibacterium smegmatis]